MEAPEIPSPSTVRTRMPDASEEELEEAAVNLRNYLAVVYRVVLRLEAEGKLGQDKKND